MLRVFLFALSILAMTAGGAHATTSEAAFFRSIEGKWSGPGEIVAGKYKGTKFTCVFDGLKQEQKTGMNIDGYCRVGMFSQPMNAIVERAARGYSGTFLDGEKGEGMDITGGRYSSNRLVVDIKRKDLRGVMVARRTGADSMQFTISVRVDGSLVPVIGFSLERTGEASPRLAQR